MFTHELGKEAISKTTKLKGVITARSENLYGCNRYYIQPPVGADSKVPDGWWFDEDDINVLNDAIETKPKSTGGPISQHC